MAITRERLRALIQFAEPQVALRSRSVEQCDGYVLETLMLELDGEPVRGFVTRPLDRKGRLPAILYGHSHGGRYDLGAAELLEGREYLFDAPGPALARAGYVVLSIDMPVFGRRAAVSEGFASKALLWYGKSLFAQMVGDHAAALTYLAGRDDVDDTRIGAFGISMGCALSYWLAALDERIAATAHLCCLADLGTMVELGAHDGHGIYLTVPGLLTETDNGEIAGLVAPRPQLVCIGEADHLTPAPAFAKAWSDVKAGYRQAPDKLELLSEPGVGHRETASMRAAVLEFFARTL
jgi:acetyl esterase/lipase